MINFVKVTVGKTIIGTPEMQNYLGAIQLLNTGLFSIASCKVVALYLPCLNFYIISSLLSSISLFIVIALPTIALIVIPSNFPYFSLSP